MLSNKTIKKQNVMKKSMQQVITRWVGVIVMIVFSHTVFAQPPLPISPPVPPYEGMMLPAPATVVDDSYFIAEQHIMPHRPRRIRDYSWIYIDPVEPRLIKVHDLVTIIVDEKSEVTVRSGFTRKRTASLKAELKEFIRLTESGNLGNAAVNSQPTIDAASTNSVQSTGNLKDSEGIRYRIAATVVDVLPNGNLVLEARKSIRSNKDVWEYSLTGIMRSEDVNRDNTALSENVANLIIEKRQRGKVYDSTKRPWGYRLYDFFSPF